MESQTSSLSSSSSECDEFVLPLPRQRRATKSKTSMPRRVRGDFQPQTPIFFALLKKGKPGVHHGKSNSNAHEIPMEDIRQAESVSLRKNSCCCEACGGEKLAKAFQMRVLPKREVVQKPFKITGLKDFGSFIRGYRKPTMIGFPGMDSIRLSMLVQSPPNTIYVKPPETPALRKLMENPEKAKIKTKKTVPKSRIVMSLHPMKSGLPPIKEGKGTKNINKLHTLIPPIRLTARATPSTSYSDRKGPYTPKTFRTKGTSSVLTDRKKDQDRLYATDSRTARYPQIPRVSV